MPANFCCDTAAAAKILKVKESNWGLVEERGGLGVEQKMVSIARVAVVVVVLNLYRKENASVFSSGESNQIYENRS